MIGVQRWGEGSQGLGASPRCPRHSFSELVDARAKRVATVVHGSTRRRAAMSLAIGIDEGRAHLRQAICVRRFHVAQLTHLAAMQQLVERADRVVTVVVRQYPQHVRPIGHRLAFDPEQNERQRNQRPDFKLKHLLLFS